MSTTARRLSPVPNVGWNIHTLHARQRESTAALGETYALRAGIAGTLARGIRRCRLRRTRYRGQPEVQLGHILAATGRNFLRLGEWSLGMSRQKPPRSPLARLCAEPVAA